MEADAADNWLQHDELAAKLILLGACLLLLIGQRVFERFTALLPARLRHGERGTVVRDEEVGPNAAGKADLCAAPRLARRSGGSTAGEEGSNRECLHCAVSECRGGASWREAVRSSC